MQNRQEPLYAAAIEVDEAGLFNKLKELLQSPEKRNAAGNKAKELYNEKAGAVERAIKEIEKFLADTLPPRPSAPPPKI